jgi:hypothetical protein
MSGRDERIEWLYGWWERIDAWVAARSAAPLTDGATGRELAA